MDLPIVMRPATADDLAFFFATALQSYFYSSSNNRHIIPSVFFIEHKAIFEKILKRQSAALSIACLEEDPAVIIGFILAESLRNTLHYIYVKRPFRRFGVARKMLESAEIDIARCNATHWTNDFSAIMRKKCYNSLVYNPYLLVG